MHKMLTAKKCWIGVAPLFLIVLWLTELSQISYASDLGVLLAQSGHSNEKNTGSEHFLQNFISRSLVPEDSSKEVAPPRQGNQATDKALSQGPTEIPALSFGEHATGELTAAASKMMVVLAGILSVLIAGVYVLRRYVIPLASNGQNGQPLQLVAKVSITPKSTVALIKVPGKSLVLGISGTTIIALGEIPEEVVEEEEPVVESLSESFAASLHRYATGQESHNEHENTLLTVQEMIQKKVNGLKQL
jgi:flagellar biogenesis protein FliO